MLRAPGWVAMRGPPEGAKPGRTVWWMKVSKPQKLEGAKQHGVPHTSSWE